MSIGPICFVIRISYWDEYLGGEGVKTGFTSKAGRCLIAKVSQDGSDLLLVILNSKRRWNTATSLINYGLRMAQGRSVDRPLAVPLLVPSVHSPYEHLIKYLSWWKDV